MTFALRTQFHVERPWGQRPFKECRNSVLNVKAVVAAFNQEKALVGAFSVISDGTFSSTGSQPRNWPKLIRHNEATDTFVAAEIGNSAAHSDG